MIKTPAPLRVNIDSHPSGILIHIATERLFSSLESALESLGCGAGIPADGQSESPDEASKLLPEGKIQNRLTRNRLVVALCRLKCP